MSDSKDLRSTLTTLKAEQGLTPTLLLLESVFHHPDSGSTQNTHISFYVRLAWEREGLVYEPHHLKQFLSPSGWSQVLKAHENGEFELEATGKIPEIPEGFSFEDFRTAALEQTITPLVTLWTKNLLGYTPTFNSSASCFRRMNEQREYECQCTKEA
jgi:hypothetical protein